MKRVLLSLGVAILVMFAMPAFVGAATYNPLSDACSGVNNSPTCTSSQNVTTNPLTGPNGTLVKVANVVAIIAGIAAVIIIIISGIQYMTANGDAQKAASARRTIISTVIGLVVIVAAQFIIVTIIKGLS